jgi:23S rRNA pseudouridine1911/1915/1917 synthase
VLIKYEQSTAGIFERHGSLRVNLTCKMTEPERSFNWIGRRQLMQILYEDNHLLVVDKPAGLPTQGALSGTPSLISQAKQYIRQKYRKPGNVYLGVVSRLDSVTSGVIVLARTSKAAARLTEQFRSRSAEKTYWAVVEGKPQPAAGELVDWIAKNEREQRMEVVPAGPLEAREARLAYKTLHTSDGVSLVEINLETGRKHQIRLQLASRGHPILGDAKYGSKRRFASGIALHCRKLVIEHPTTKQRLTFESKPPATWQKFIERLS